MTQTLLLASWLFYWTPLAIILYTLYIASYRLFLSPLAGTPGPVLAALTSWYEFYYDVILPGQYVFKIKEMHEQYGPVVRISPRELSFSDPSFVDVIYAPGPGQRRNKDLHSVRALGTAQGLGATIGHELHKSRREPLSGFFSHQAILRLAPSLIERKTKQLDETFARSSISAEILNLSDLYFGLTNDVACEYSFGRNDDLLADPARANVLRNNIRSLLRTTNFAKHFPWIRDLLALLPEKYAPPGVQDMMKFRRQIRQQIVEILDQKPSSMQTAQRDTSIFNVLIASPKLPPSEKSLKRLEDEATLLVMAGTDSPATSLTIAHYYLLENPTIMAKLRQELAEKPSSTLPELERLPYLNAVLTEAHRLLFGLSGRHPQIDPDNHITYADKSTDRHYVYPPGTVMGVQTLVLHTNENIFPDPWVFKPERWLGSDGASRRKYLLSFNKGPRQCLGIHLANAELCLALSVIAQWDMELFETDEDDVKFLHDYFVAAPRLDSKGVRVRVKSRAMTLTE